MYTFKILTSIPWEDIKSCYDSNIFKVKEWADFLVSSQKVIPFIVSINSHDKCIGYFIGYKFSKFGIKIIGSPFEGWTTSYQGISLNQEISRIERVKIYKQLSAFCLKYCHFFQFADWNLDFSDVSQFKYIEKIESYWLDISPEIDYLLKSFKQKSGQYSIHKAQKLGVVIQEPTNLNIFAHDYYNQLIDVFDRQGKKPTYNCDRIKHLINSLSQNQRVFLEARHPETNECMATIIFVLHNGMAFYWGASSYREYQKYCPNELLMFEAIKKLKALGVTIIEMEGIRPYKEKYNPIRYSKPKILVSKYNFLISGKRLAKDILSKVYNLVRL